MTNSEPVYTKSYRNGGSYNVRVALKGRTGEHVWTINVAKRSVSNASARGGAYREEWHAAHGITTGNGDTRTEAVKAVLYQFSRKGIEFVGWID